MFGLLYHFIHLLDHSIQLLIGGVRSIWILDGGLEYYQIRSQNL
tara:strand:- start:231 stop:362 length:132 start_codon:yes stop_codon:yes gene_type:complete